MNSNKHMISRPHKFEAGQAQVLQRQPDCIGYGVERKNDLGDDNSLAAATTRNLLNTTQCESDAGADLLHLGKLGREDVEHMRGFHNGKFCLGLDHSPHSARDRCSHDGHGESFRERESCAAKSLSWLIDSSNYEQSLEAMMEERDQCRAAIAVSNVSNNSNRATISPVNSPIDRAGVSVTPGDATFSSRRVKQVSWFIELAKTASQNAPTSVGDFCQDFVNRFSFMSSLKCFGDLNHHQQSMRQMQNGYPAAHKRAFSYDRVH